MQLKKILDIFVENFLFYNMFLPFMGIFKYIKVLIIITNVIIISLKTFLSYIITIIKNNCDTC